MSVFSPGTAIPVERFAALADTGVVDGFVGRVAGVAVDADRETVLGRLEDFHRVARQELGVAERTFITAEQVHGKVVSVLEAGDVLPASPLAGADGLVTDRRDVCLGVYAADCCAVYLVDPVHGALGLVHAGRKGTELGILGVAVAAMGATYGSRPADLRVQLGPCIRPPWYEVDFAADLVRQCRALGLGRVSDCGTCTAAHPARYYSYRREKGRTGRMLALLALA